MTGVLGILVSYLLGAVPASYLAGRSRGVDLRRHGSGNLGATNTFRVLGPRVAAPVMVFDVLKGFLPVWFLPGVLGLEAQAWPLAFGGAAILGHVFPIYMGFRGGKGVATGAGVFLALAPVAVAIAFLVWLVALRVSRMVSLASILAALCVVPLLFVTGTSPEVRVLGILVALFIVVAHRANVGRILRGEESRFGGRSASSMEGPVSAAAVSESREGG